MSADEFSDSGFEDMMEAAGMAPQPREQRDTLAVRFFLKPQKNEKKSRDAGRPIYEDTEQVEIRIPGDRDVLVRPASAEDKARWEKQYEAFKKNQDQTTASGMPLGEWPLITASLREELAYFGIRTVEQLAGVPDAMLQRIGPILALRQKARDWVARAKDDAVLVKLRDENDNLTARVTALERMLETASAQLHGEPVRPTAPSGAASMTEVVAAVMAAMKAQEAQPDAVPKRRGRPPGSKNKPKVNGSP